VQSPQYRNHTCNLPSSRARPQHRACLRQAAAGQGYRVFGSVRKQIDADRLKSDFGANFTATMEL
jgi:hypothetical protein